MALVSNGVKVSIDSEQIPTGFTLPTITEVTPGYTNNYTVVVAKTAYENASASTAFTALVADIKTQLDVIVTADYDVAGNTVTVFYDFLAAAYPGLDEDVAYTTTAEAITCSVRGFLAVT